MSKQLWELPEMEWTRYNIGVLRAGYYQVRKRLDHLGSVLWVAEVIEDKAVRVFGDYATVEAAQSACVADRDARLEALGARRVTHGQ